MTRIHVPSNVLCGDPPARLIRSFDVHASGGIVARPVSSRRALIVFESIDHVAKALGVDVHTMLIEWPIDQALQVTEEPCLVCMRAIEPDGTGHRPTCKLVKAALEARRVVETRKVREAPKPIDPVEFQPTETGTVVDEAPRPQQSIHGELVEYLSTALDVELLDENSAAYDHDLHEPEGFMFDE